MPLFITYASYSHSGVKFKGIAEKAAKVAGAYTPLGK